MPRWNKQTKREENVSQRTGEFPLQNVSWSLFSRLEAVVTYSKHVLWFFHPKIYNTTYTNMDHEYLMTFLTFNGQILVPYFLIPRWNKQTKSEEKCVTMYWWTSLPQYFLEAYFPAVKRYSPTAHMVRDRSHEWQWTNCGSLYPDPKMQQTNKQTNKKEEKCVTKYWRTSLTKCILEAYFPALKR